MTQQEQAAEPTLATALGDYTGYLLRRAYARARECADRVIPAPYRVRDVVILALLHTRGPSSQQQLADLANINRTIMVKLVDDLEQRGLLRRERNTTDRRSYALVPTTAGLAALRALQPAVARGEALLTTNLNGAERSRLVELLQSVLPDSDDALSGSLGQRTGYLISPAHHYLRQRAVAVLAPLHLEPRQFGVLATLETDQPCSQQHLATWLWIGAPVVLQIVDELEEAGLVLRTRNTGDRRAYDLTLTAAGRARVAAARRAIGEIQAELAGRLGRNGDRELRRLLGKLLGTPEED